MSYLSLDQLLLRIRSGKGLAIVIEGIKNGDDEWVYSQWFGDLAHLVTFYPQDGYSRVYDAVENLRNKSPHKLVAALSIVTSQLKLKLNLSLKQIIQNMSIALNAIPWKIIF